MEDKSNLLNFIFAVIIFMIGLMHLEGLFHKKNKKGIIKTMIDWDRVLLSELDNETLIKKSDQLAFIICGIMSFLTFLNGLLAYYINLPNVSIIFILIAVIATWPIRFLFLYAYKNKSVDKLPRIWPFK